MITEAPANAPVLEAVTGEGGYSCLASSSTVKRQVGAMRKFAVLPYL